MSPLSEYIVGMDIKSGLPGIVKLKPINKALRRLHRGIVRYTFVGEMVMEMNIVSDWGMFSLLNTVL